MLFFAAELFFGLLLGFFGDLLEIVPRAGDIFPAVVVKHHAALHAGLGHGSESALGRRGHHRPQKIDRRAQGLTLLQLAQNSYQETICRCSLIVISSFSVKIKNLTER